MKKSNEEATAPQGEIPVAVGQECIHCGPSQHIPGSKIRTNIEGECPACGKQLIPNAKMIQSEPEKKKRELPRFDDLGPNAPTFEEYFNLKIEYIKVIQSLMAKSLSDDLAIMDSQVREIEAHQTNMKSILAWSDGYLDVSEHLSLSGMPSRANDWTDLDRQKALAAAVVRQRRFRGVVRGIVESMQTRISYAQSCMKAFGREGGRP